MGYFLALLSTLIWAGNITLARGVVDTLPPFGFAFWRWMIAGLVVLIIFAPHIMKNLDAIKRNFLFLNGVAFFGAGLFHSLLYLSAHTSSAFNISLIAMSSPIFVLIIGMIFGGENLSVKKIIAIVLTFIGVALLISRGDWQLIQNFSFQEGDIWMLIASVSFAIYNVLMQEKPRELDTRTLIVMLCLLGAFWASPFYIYELLFTEERFTWHPDLLLIFGYVVIFASIASYFFWNRAIFLLRASRASLMYCFVPVFSAPFGFLFLGEGVSMIQIVSMLCVLFGVLLTLKHI